MLFSMHFFKLTGIIISLQNIWGFSLFLFFASLPFICQNLQTVNFNANPMFFKTWSLEYLHLTCLIKTQVLGVQPQPHWATPSETVGNKYCLVLRETSSIHSESLLKDFLCNLVCSTHNLINSSIYLKRIIHFSAPWLRIPLANLILKSYALTLCYAK